MSFSTNPNAYLRRDDVDALLRTRMDEIQHHVDRMIGEIAATGEEEVGPLRKQYLAGQIAQRLSEIEAVRKLTDEVGGMKEFTYRSFSQCASSRPRLKSVDDAS